MVPHYSGILWRATRCSYIIAKNRPAQTYVLWRNCKNERVWIIRVTWIRTVNSGTKIVVVYVYNSNCIIACNNIYRNNKGYVKWAIEGNWYICKGPTIHISGSITRWEKIKTININYWICPLIHIIWIEGINTRGKARICRLISSTSIKYCCVGLNIWSRNFYTSHLYSILFFSRIV